MTDYKKKTGLVCVRSDIKSGPKRKQRTGTNKEKTHKTVKGLLLSARGGGASGGGLYDT